MKSDGILSRRNFVASTSMAGAGAILMAFPGSGRGAESQAPTSPPSRPQTSQTPGMRAQDQQPRAQPPTPVESLTAQHGAVGRLLLVYEDAAGQLQNGRQVDAKPLYDATRIIQTAVIQFHTPLEEEFIYPRLEKSAQYAGTIKTLREQHAAARDINTMLMEMTKSGELADPKQAMQAMNDFRRMLAAHVAWEHSEIFPAFREMTPADQYLQLGRQFQQKAQSALGDQGFARILSRVASIESSFGMNDLSRFTARARRVPVAAGESAQKPVATEE